MKRADEIMRMIRYVFSIQDRFNMRLIREIVSFRAFE